VSRLFPEVADARREAFWRQQERRRQTLGQPCCTQSNMSWSLIDMEGDFCVVIHGESDCLNCFFHHNGRRAVDYYSTRLSETQLVSGHTLEPLRHLLQLLATERRPAAVIVLGTCPVEVISDPFEPVVHEVSAATGVPMVALRTHGLTLMRLVECQDWLYATLAGLGEPPEQRHGVNLIGLPPGAASEEARQVLEAAGVTVNGLYPNQTRFDAWQRIHHATHSFVVDSSTVPRLTEALRSGGQQVHDVPVPIGLYQTGRYYGLVGDRLGCTEAVQAATAAVARAHDDAWLALKARLTGRVVALCIRMLKTHRTDLLAYEGLGPLELLRGLGMEVVVLVQGPPEARETFRARLEALGHADLRMEVFRGPWELGVVATDVGADAVVCSDVARKVVEEAGLPMISSSAWRPFYAGIPHNLELLAGLADTWA